jgi:hypothetical protein
MEDENPTGAADKSAAWPPARKAYDTPSLQVYGDLSEITQSMKFFGKDDGGTHANRHYTR